MSTSSLLLLILANVLGGASSPVGAWTLQTWHPAAVCFWRALATAVLFLPFIKRLDFGREAWLRMAGVGVFGFGVPIVIGAFGLAHSTATEGALLTCVEPVCIVIMSSLILKEALNSRKIAAIALGVGGAALIMLQGLPFLTELSAPHWRGDILLFTQGFFWALYTIIGKPALKKVDAMSFTAITSILCLPVLGLALLFSPKSAAGAWTPFWIGIVMTFIGPLVWNYAMEKVPASTLANFVFLQPLVGVLGGILFLGEHFTIWSAIGGALILFGVYVSAKEDSHEGKDLRVREVLDVPERA